DQEPSHPCKLPHFLTICTHRLEMIGTANAAPVTDWLSNSDRPMDSPETHPCFPGRTFVSRIRHSESSTPPLIHHSDTPILRHSTTPFHPAVHRPSTFDFRRAFRSSS